MEEINRLQNILLLLRRAVGWSAEEFGDRIGVTRQTINNLEAKRTTLTKTQYIAIRAVLDAEINNKPDETQMLSYMLEIFVDNPEKYKEEDRNEFLAKANMLTPSILAGTSTRKVVSKEIIHIASTLGLLVAAVISSRGMKDTVTESSSWIAKMLKKEDDHEIK